MSMLDEFVDMVIGTRNKKSNRQHKAEFSKLEGIKCHYCSVALSWGTITVEHIIPEVVIQASFDAIEPEVKPACFKCNNERSVMPGHVGMLFNSRDFRQIRSSARYLANLVRPNQKMEFFKSGELNNLCDVIGAC